MSKPAPLIALGAIDVTSAASDDAPEWLLIFPKGEQRSHDGRGPWFYEDAQDVIAASYAAPGRIHVDLDHSSIRPNVADRRAYGYIAAMEEREDGIYGKVDWTAAGAALMKDRAYWGVSPVFPDRKDGKVTRIISVALTNNPALRHLTALNSEAEYGMEFLQKLAEALGLPSDASEDDVMAAIAKMKDGGSGGEEALTALTAALDLDDDAGVTEMVATAKALKAGADGTSETVEALTAQVKALEDGNKRRDAEAAVDKAIADKRPIAAERDTWVALHMENPERFTALVSKLPQLGAIDFGAQPPAGDGVTALTAEQKVVAKQLGLSDEDMLASLKDERDEKEAL